MHNSSMLSKIFRCYQDSLNCSISRYKQSYEETTKNGLSFYDDFLNTLIIDFESKFSKPHTMNLLNSKIMEYFQKSELNFVAIDGTCSADPFKDFMVFFAAAYGVRGKIGIETDPPKLSYERWSMDQDVSIVSYIPVPYAESGDISDVSFENFAVDDASKINLSHIHTRLMELSEIYLAYQMASASTLSTPQIILMDRSLSGVLMSTDGYLSAVRLFGHPIGTRQLVFRDGLVASAHPFNDRLSVPTVKKFARWKFLVKELDSKNEIQIEELIQKTNIDKNKWAKTLNETYARELFEYDGFKISRKFDFAASWFDTVRFFEEFCDRLFHRREAEALLYPVLENGHERLRWMSPEDIAFLINVGIRALIEKCWEKRILLIGIVKDSATKFFSRNYIGVMRELGHYPQVPVKYLPWTDRSLLEGLAYQLDDLSAPWATVEFDSAYMSLHVEEDEKGRYIRGHRGLLVNQERLFARSLGQFYKKSSGSKTLMGHVVFLDRLLDPYFDNQFMNSDSIPTISSDVLGEIQPAFFGDNTVMNYGQATVMNLLGILTRNLFPEVIGYPDPLHKADWGAKSVKRRVDRLIQSSEITFRINPLNQKFRTLRDSARR